MKRHLAFIQVKQIRNIFCNFAIVAYLKAPFRVVIISTALILLMRLVIKIELFDQLVNFGAQPRFCMKKRSMERGVGRMRALSNTNQ